VTVVRTLSMSAGLATSTVTPGNAPPDSSLTIPEIALVCAPATTGHISSDTTTRVRNNDLRMYSPFQNKELRTKNSERNVER
jgi:hypothetical protein